MKHRKWLAGLALLSCMGVGSAQDRYDGIGFYFGNPVPSSIPVYNAFVETVNQVPNSTPVFVDFRYPIWSVDRYGAQWSTSARWAANRLAGLTGPDYLNRRDSRGRPAIIPIVSIGLTDVDTAYQRNLPSGHPQRGLYGETAAVMMMRDIAAGKYDAGTYRVWPAIFDAFREAGFHRIYLRIGWEQNGDWYGWRARTPTTRSAYVAAWRRIATLARNYEAAYGMQIETVWSPTATFSHFGTQEEATYPGDEYVDIIAPTAYGSIWNPTETADESAYYDWSTGQGVTLEEWYANPANRRQAWDYPGSDYLNPTNGWGLPAAIEFARSRNKRFGLSETGTGGLGTVTRSGGPADDGYFPLYLAERIAPAMARGLQVEFIDVWPMETGNDGRNFLSGERPLEAQAWRELGVVMAAATEQRNVALNRSPIASSTYKRTYDARYAVDGNPSTRWISQLGTQSEAIRVDLGQRFTVSRVRLAWDTGYASSYTIQTSVDGTTWTPIYTTGSGNGGIDDVVGLNGLGRFVRIELSARASGARGYSLQEMEIYP